MSTNLSASKTVRTSTLADVAAAAGVALSTASGAFTGKKRMAASTRAHILRVAQTLDFAPNPDAQRLSGGAHGHDVVGLFSSYLDIGVATQKIKTVQRLLTERGCEVPLYSSGAHRGAAASADTRALLLRRLCRQRPRAIACFTGDLEGDALRELETFQARGGTVVCFDYPVSLSCDAVHFDRADNTYQAVRHLVGLGHRRIGFTFDDARNTGAAQQRRMGFERALREMNVPLQSDWIFPGLLDDSRFEQGGRDLADRFLALGDKPTALCNLPDLAAVSFIARAREASGVRVPHDLSVVANDDTPLARYAAVPLTTTTHPVEQIACAVVELLTDRLENGGKAMPPRQIVVRGALVERQSASHPPKDERSQR